MMELKKPSAKSKVEAVLFSVGHKISLDEISRLCRSRKEDVLEALKELQQEYEAKQSSLMLVEDGDQWKFAVKDHLIHVIRKIVTETELTKSVMETLAVIAFKYPILQSDLIKIRTNKAYDHLVELEKSGYITRQKHSRTNLIKLTEKFFRYFDLTEEKLKDKFKDFDSIARAIKEKEEEVDKIKEDQQKRAEDLKKQDDRIRQEIESLDKAGDEFSVPLEQYSSKPEDGQPVQPAKTIDGMEIVDVSKEKSRPKEDIRIVIPEIPQLQENPNHQEMTQPSQHGMKEKTKKSGKARGIPMTPEIEKKVNERVEEIVSGKESKDETKVNDNSNNVQ